MSFVVPTKFGRDYAAEYISPGLSNATDSFLSCAKTGVRTLDAGRYAVFGSARVASTLSGKDIFVRIRETQAPSFFSTSVFQVPIASGGLYPLTMMAQLTLIGPPVQRGFELIFVRGPGTNQTVTLSQRFVAVWRLPD